MSCDLLDTEVPGPHYVGDVFDVIDDEWDLMIAHPPCTYLAVSGIHWNSRISGRTEKTGEALNFVRLDMGKLKQLVFGLKNYQNCFLPISLMDGRLEYLVCRQVLEDGGTVVELTLA